VSDAIYLPSFRHEIAEQLTIACSCANQDGLVRVSKQPREWTLYALGEWIESFDAAGKYLSARGYARFLPCVRRQVSGGGCELILCIGVHGRRSSTKIRPQHQPPLLWRRRNTLSPCMLPRQGRRLEKSVVTWKDRCKTVMCVCVRARVRVCACAYIRVCFCVFVQHTFPYIIEHTRKRARAQTDRQTETHNTHARTERERHTHE